MATGKQGEFTEEEAAALTEASMNEVARAWHDARDAAQALGELPERAASKAQDVLKAHKIKYIRDKVYVMGRKLVIHNDELHDLERQRAPVYHTILNRLRVLPGIGSVLVLPEKIGSRGG